MGYICNKNIKCADCEHYRRNPDEDRMFCYAEVDEKAEEAKNKAAKAAYVVVNHYSNENISSTLFPFWKRRSSLWIMPSRQLMLRLPRIRRMA